MKNNFVAIDFETMTPELTSACAVGIVKVVDNVISEKFYSLIKPIPDGRNERNTFIHGITEEMVANAPTWKELFPRIESLFESRVIVCHQASTDINILSELNRYYGITIGRCMTYDTYEITHKSLMDSCCDYGIDPGIHHDALCDASACAELYLACLGIKFKKPNYVKVSKPGMKARELSSSTKKPLSAEDVENPNTPFFKKKVVITGLLTSYPIREELAQLLKKYGADINSSISGKTDIVIVGAGAGPSKLEKVAEYNAKGRNIRLIFEDELLQVLSENNMR